MNWWFWLVAGVGAVALVWVALVVVLLFAGRRDEARALAGFIPDCLVLIGRLMSDPVGFVNLISLQISEIDAAD